MDTEAKKNKKRYQGYKAKGLCARCGLFYVVGSVTCPSCQEYVRQWRRDNDFRPL